jgi:hypothetical protein
MYLQNSALFQYARTKRSPLSPSDVMKGQGMPGTGSIELLTHRFVISLCLPQCRDMSRHLLSARQRNVHSPKFSRSPVTLRCSRRHNNSLCKCIARIIQATVNWNQFEATQFFLLVSVVDAPRCDQAIRQTNESRYLRVFVRCRSDDLST